ncbi:BPL-N domain-containing protein [Ammonicoccus fulvus]|uniref:BPL-N domain-containing protein n=1 Tax=Ammonicoccus fulvus TaxID=3138240 RepID=A0ABZ3FVE4_9ACTN
MTGILALVYRGPASLPGCPEAVASLLRASPWGFDVRFVGPKESTALGPQSLASAVVYAQPGGGELLRAYRKMRRSAAAITDFVQGGGRYLGFCLGAYLAGETPGFGLFPGDTDQYATSRGADVRTEEETTVEVTWAGRPRRLYFQDGPWFDLDGDRGAATVLARYHNDLPAAVVADCGAGRVGLVGPHPEATPDWFTDAGLPVPEPLGLDLGLDLIDRVMRG